MDISNNTIFFIGFNLIFSYFLNISFLIPNLISFGTKLNLFDNPDSRKIHSKPLLFTGGLSIFLSCFIVIILNFIYLENINLGFDYKLIIIFFGSLLCLLIGLLDDIYKVSPWPRLFFQIIVSSFVWSQGIAFKAITISSFTYDIPAPLSFIITILWITGIINAFNWIDGIDGLAAGVSIISLLSFIIIFFGSSGLDYLIFMASLIGSCLGFLKYNFHPARLIMGDGGSYLLGFNIACLGLISTHSNINSIYLPILLISLPIFDMVYVLVKRISKKQSPFFPDNNHIHHRLIRAGFKDQNIVLMLYGIMMIFSTIGILITYLIEKK